MKSFSPASVLLSYSSPHPNLRNHIPSFWDLLAGVFFLSFLFLFFFFLKIFDVGHLNFFIVFVTVLLLFLFFCFLATRPMWDLGSLKRNNLHPLHWKGKP